MFKRHSLDSCAISREIVGVLQIFSPADVRFQALAASRPELEVFFRIPALPLVHVPCMMIATALQPPIFGC